MKCEGSLKFWKNICTQSESARRLLLLSDIHGNITAFESVIESLKDKQVDACVLLGDFIDYCPHSNEVIQEIQNFQIPIICNIWGNHEDAIINEHYDSFSSPRGVVSAKYTKGILTQDSLNFLNTKMEKSGFFEFSICEKRCLAVHGNIENHFWKSIFPDVQVELYSEYDFVFSGHSHYPHFFEKYIPIENPKTRNKKKIIFINPGSVGQPRNLCPYSQYAILDMKTESVEFVKVPYDIKKEQADFSDKIDEFYKTRLEVGV